MKDLFIAAKKGNINAVKALISSGHPLDLQFNDQDEIDPNGKTALYAAVLNKHYEVAKILLKAGANPNVSSSPYYSTPLFIASAHHNLNMVNLLIKYQANVNFESIQGCRAIDFTSDQAIINVLIKAGATTQFLQDQLHLTKNFNLLVDEFKSNQVSMFAYLNKDGSCSGLSKLFILYAKQERVKEFEFYISFINSLNEERIKILVQNHIQGLKSADKLLNFMQDVIEIQETQFQTNFQSIGAYWHDSTIIACSFENLASQLKACAILKLNRGITKQYKYISTGDHAMALIVGYDLCLLSDQTSFEKDKMYFKSEGNDLIYTVIGQHNKIIKDKIPNAVLKYGLHHPLNLSEIIPHFPDILKYTSEAGHTGAHFYDSNKYRGVKICLNEEQLANELINVIELFNNELKKSQTALEFCHLSFGDENRELDDLLVEYDGAIKKEIGTPLVLMDYRSGKMSRRDAAYALHQQISSLTPKTDEFENLEKKLMSYLTTNPSRSSIQYADLTINNGFNSLDQKIIHLVSKFSNIELIQPLIVKGADVNIKDKHGNTCLFYAAKSGCMTMIQHLLNVGIDINLKNYDGWSALFEAINNGYVEAAKLLIAKGADVNLKDNDGWVALFYAIKTGNVAAATLLIAKGANVHLENHQGWSSLSIAASHRCTGIITTLLEAGANVNQKNNNGWTPLTVAAWNGQIEIAKSLLASGAYINHIDNDGFTPLGIAINSGQIKMVKFLLAIGADINHTNKEGSTPLGLAVRNAQTEIVKSLLAVGANINHIDNDGFTPLAIAAQHGHIEIAKSLLALGADIHQKNNEGLTPLAIAVQQGQIEIVKSLLEAGADIKTSTNEGKTPLDMAKKQRDQEIILLLKQQEDLNEIFSNSHFSDSPDIAIQLSKLFYSYAHPPLFSTLRPTHAKLANTIAEELKAHPKWTGEECKKCIEKHIRVETLHFTDLFRALLNEITLSYKWQSSIGETQKKMIS